MRVACSAKLAHFAAGPFRPLFIHSKGRTVKHIRLSRQSKPGPWRGLAIAALLFAPNLVAQGADSVDAETAQGAVTGEIEEVVVTSKRRAEPIIRHAGNIANVDIETLDWLEAQHIHEVMNKVPGAWIVRGSGQEHQTAIRSPVLGGGGACGGFLPLEDGIPVRPAGFCNINLFLDVFNEEARSIEVVRGPGNALYGSNALHGTINVLMPMPGEANPHLSLEGGANSFVRGKALIPLDAESNWLVAGAYAHDGGFREDSGYDQGKLHIKRRWSGESNDFILGFTATDLDQDTAGFIVGEDAYKDPAVNRTNPDPDAFRDASSQRLYGIWNRSLGPFEMDLRPYLRHSDMSFLHYERPGQPVEDNGHHSAGALLSLTAASDTSTTIIGFDFDYADAWLRQTQDGPTEGNPRQRETFPEGKHYDYEVKGLTLAAYVQQDWQLSERWALSGGLRLEYTHYDYDNRMIAGNTRDDGTPCGFGGCVYSRPEDRSDDFTDWAPNLSLTYALAEGVSLFATAARGFRVPQMLELYRLQFGQSVTDLESETIDSIEFGVHAWGNSWTTEIAAFAMRKRDSAFRDAEGYNVSGARSKHHGIELLLDWAFHPDWLFHVNASWARHTWDFDEVGRGETFVSGNDIDHAPEWLGSAELRYQPPGRFSAGLQSVTLGEYYLDGQNRFDYPGHTLLNLRASWALTDTTSLFLRLNNLADRDVADRADYAQNNYRYLPGRGRELFAEIRYAPNR